MFFFPSHRGVRSAPRNLFFVWGIYPGVYSDVYQILYENNWYKRQVTCIKHKRNNVIHDFTAERHWEPPPMAIPCSLINGLLSQGGKLGPRI